MTGYHAFARNAISRLRLAGPALVFAGCTALLITGCGGGQGGAKGAFGKALQAVGLQDKPEETEGEQAPTAKARSVPLKLQAGANLNAGNGNRPLALVVKLYRLREVHRFEQTPFDAFLDAERERAALGEDLLDTREVLLNPGQSYEVVENLPAGTAYVGVVALFRSPAASRWRFAFDAQETDRIAGIALGLHACAMTVSSGALVTRLGSEPHSLSSVNCAAAAGP